MSPSGITFFQAGHQAVSQLCKKFFVAPVNLPLGFGIEVPDGYAGYVFPRTSMAVKGLVCELPPVDSGYRGEIHAIISNVSNQTQELSKGSRVGQLVITPVVIADFVTELGEQRGTGGFGSTGK